MDYIIAGAFDDYVDSGNGTDLVFGDHGSIIMSEDFPYKLLSAETTFSTCTPGNDTITLGEGDDIGFGGGLDGDTIWGNAGRDLIVGDFAVIKFYSSVPNDTDPLIPYPRSIDTLTCDDGGEDFLYGGDGVDYIIAGALDDTVDSGAGMDLVFGDHGYILLSEDTPYKLVFANSTDISCKPGVDFITLGEGHDIAFGGKYQKYDCALGSCFVLWELLCRLALLPRYCLSGLTTECMVNILKVSHDLR